MIERKIANIIETKLFKKKVVILYGARQVGKTTLIKEISRKIIDSAYYSCDEPDIRAALTDKTSTELKSFIGNHKLVILDEAQLVKNIGITLKLLIDNFPNIQIIATGSSSFELSNEIAEPLTGRKVEFHLYPIATSELVTISSKLEEKRLLEQRLIYGAYPEIVGKNINDIKERLREIATSYLYKDIFALQQIRNAESLEKLLQALALQIGNEVSYNELSKIIGIDKNTVNQYIHILEQAFIIFRLKPFTTNKRTELKKLRKIYFFDTGIRNALINNFNALSFRNDAGALLENFLISERIKSNGFKQKTPNIYFWRSHQNGEIDYIEEDGQINAFEFKSQCKNFKKPHNFIIHYPKATIKCIDKENFMDFVL